MSQYHVTCVFDILNIKIKLTWLNKYFDGIGVDNDDEYVNLLGLATQWWCQADRWVSSCLGAKWARGPPCPQTQCMLEEVMGVPPSQSQSENQIVVGFVMLTYMQQSTLQGWKHINLPNYLLDHWASWIVWQIETHGFVCFRIQRSWTLKWVVLVLVYHQLFEERHIVRLLG